MNWVFMSMVMIVFQSVFHLKYIKIIFFIFLKIFFILVYQNNLKIYKKINFKLKKFKILKNTM